MFSHSFHRLLQNPEQQYQYPDQDQDLEIDQAPCQDQSLDSDQSSDQDIDIGSAVFRIRFIHVSKI